MFNSLHEECEMCIRDSRSTVSLVAAGSFRCSADIVKAIALGADACYVASAPLIAMEMCIRDRILRLPQ